MSFPNNILPPTVMRVENSTSRCLNEDRIALMRLRGDFGEVPERSADI